MHLLYRRLLSVALLVWLVGFAPVLAKTNEVIRVGVMLPLHKDDGDGLRMLEYYRGLLLACNQLKTEGVSIEVRAWNVPNGADIRSTLLNEGASNCDLIFGPLYSTQTAALAGFCQTYNIKMVVPFSINENTVNQGSAVYQIYQSPAMLQNASIRAFRERFPDCQPVFIDCADKTSTKGAFTKALRDRLQQDKVKFRLTALASSADDFAKAFSKKKRNVVILNTGRSPELRAAIQKIKEMKETHPDYQVTLFGYNEWFMYMKENEENFYTFDAYIPSTYYYNAVSSRTRSVEQEYKEWFHEDMQKALPRFALTGYDQGEYFLRGVNQYGKAFTGGRHQVVWTPVQTPLHFEKVDGGGYQNTAFELIHFKADRSIEAVQY